MKYSVLPMLRRVAFLFIFLVFGVLGVVGQPLLSTDEIKYYYKVQIVQNASYYMVPQGVRNDSPNNYDYATVYNADHSHMYWYFKSAGDDYYYIINGKTEEYLKFIGNVSDSGQENTCKTMAFDSSEAEVDKFKFKIELVSSSTDKFYLIPKVLAHFGDDKNKYLNKKSGPTSSKAIGTSLGTYDGSKWKFFCSQCEKPLISVENHSISLSCPTSGAIIRYTTDGSSPYTSNTAHTYSSGESIVYPSNSNYQLKAAAYYTNYGLIFWSDIATFNIAYISSLDEITDNEGVYYLTADIEDAGSYTTIENFSGLFDGQFHTISGLTQPLFGTIDAGVTDGSFPAYSGIVRNVVLKDVNIVGHDGNTGAIACEITGGACVYNSGILSGSVGGTGNVGGLVGLLQHTVYDNSTKQYSLTRVINCYSYADITSKGADSDDFWAAGIVGNNSYESKVENYPFDPNNRKNCQLKTAVINCMFYGDITTDHGSNIAPVYGNNSMSALNGGGKEKTINRYDYFLDGANFTSLFDHINDYLLTWPAEEKYLTRYEYYRSILNSNRLLCTSYITGKKGDQVYQDTACIAKWVRDESMAPYPILKKWGKYPSIINPDSLKIWDNQTDPSNPHWVYRNASRDYQGKSFGKLSVKVKPGSHASSGVQNEFGASGKSIQLTITDMDTLHYDYGYYKIQLPYYNEMFGNVNSTDHETRYGGNYTDWVVTGWKITLVDGSDGGDYEFYRNWEDGYNFADRSDKYKDLYAKSGRVFAQGGFYYVPEGVTSIEIEAYWGKAYYLRNSEQSIDRVGLTKPASGTGAFYGYDFAPAGQLSATFQGLPVYDTLQNAIKNLDFITPDDTLTVYDQAIVLVGNLQVLNRNEMLGNNLDFKLHPFTLMSADFDLDNEPDYCFQFQFRTKLDRHPIQPIRFDFLAIPELGLAIRHDDNAYAIGIFVPVGHFEITETAFMHTTQFEYDGVKYSFTKPDGFTPPDPMPEGFIYTLSSDGKTYTVYIQKKEAPVILNGGQFEQIVVRYSYNNSNYADKTSYFIMGGHFRMKRFTPGSHTSNKNKTKVRLCAVNCIGGEYPEFYLSGIYRPDIDPLYVNNTTRPQGNPHCYTNGGKFGMIAGSGYDKIVGNVSFSIDHSIIGEFYGGGINSTNPIGGSIDVTINHSLVRKYCGGPKVGKMASGKTVTTNATGTVFGQFFGGGNGGTNYYRQQAIDGNSWRLPGEVWDDWEDLHDSSTSGGTTTPVSTIVYDPNNPAVGFNPLNTREGTVKQYHYENDDDTKGYHDIFEFEVFNASNGLDGDNPTIRTYVQWTQFGVTHTGSVYNTLTDCTVLHDFYGGGNMGFVDGSVESTLKGNTKIYGSAFGGGFSATIPTFRCYDMSRPIFPIRDYAGVMHNGELDTEEIPYIQDPTVDENGNPVLDDDGNPVFHDRQYKWINEIPASWGVTGVDENNPTFRYPDNANGQWYCYTTLSLENLGVVSGNTTLNINENTKIYGSSHLVDGELQEPFDGGAFGGGDESAVLGNTTVNVNGSSGILVSNVYGGGEEATTGGSSTVNIHKGTIGIANANGTPYPNSGRVFAAGKGSTDGKELGWVKGNSTLNMTGGMVLSGVYGGGELANVGEVEDYTWMEGHTIEVPKTNGITTVNISGGTVGYQRSLLDIFADHNSCHVFGAGKGDPNPNFNTWTNVNETHVNITGGRIYGSVFGGSDVGHVLGDISVYVALGANDTLGTYGYSEIDGNIFGGGHGLVSDDVGLGVTESVTAGGTQGNVNIQVEGAGTLLGTVFGGGRIASTGIVLSTDEHAGDSIPDDGDRTFGYTDITVGGNVVIGHDYVAVAEDGEEYLVGDVGGNIYGGAMGVDKGPETTEGKMAHVKQTKVTVKGNALVKGSVNGGGESGDVWKDAEVVIDGNCTIGLDRVGEGHLPLDKLEFSGNVFGGSWGCDSLKYVNMGRVYGNSKVHVKGGKIRNCVFGGGEYASIGTIDTISGVATPRSGTGLSSVIIDGGYIGPFDESESNACVFGGGMGVSVDTVPASIIKEFGHVFTTHVQITGGTVEGSVFGGGRMGSVGKDGSPFPEYGHCTVNISGGTIGVRNNTSMTVGNVYGGGKGIASAPTSPFAGMANVKETHVNISEKNNPTFIIGSVFGSGEDGHVTQDTYVMIEGGQIGGEEYNLANPTLCEDIYHGNVYGGGRGLDQYEDEHHQLQYSMTAGKVFGNTNVTITGGRVCRNVYGGGNLAAVGVVENTLTLSGRTRVTITGGTIGVNGNSANRNGLVFGAGKGRAGAIYEHLSFVKNTEVTITGSARVMGTVFGSGDDGHVRERTKVIVGNAKVDHDWDSDSTEFIGNGVIIGTNGVAGVDGNIYGAGRGIDKDDSGHYSRTAGVVGVSTSIEVNNGYVMGSVYGGGRTSSVGYEPALAEENKTPLDYTDEYGNHDFGQTYVIIGSDDDSDSHHAIIGTEGGENGYVFGAGKGEAGPEFRELTWVYGTKVAVKGHALVRGAVFGGGEDGHVIDYSWTDPNNSSNTVARNGDTHVLIAGNCSIGEDGASGRKGNVYGGGRGIDQYLDDDGNLHYSPTAGRVMGSTHVTVTGGDVWQYVFGGGNKSTVGGRKTVNIAGGWVHKDVYGGSNEIPFNPTWIHAGLKTVNMIGGKAHKLFGCSHNTIDGDLTLFDGNRELKVVIEGEDHNLYYVDDNSLFTGDVGSLTIEAKTTNPTSFVNISGGYLYDTGENTGDNERGSIHGAGLAGVVYGSVMVNIGANAVFNAPFKEYNLDTADIKNELHYFNGTPINDIDGHKATKLQVSGSVFGGADYYQSENNPGDWNHFNVKGYSNIYIDGKGYDMTTEIAHNTPFNNLPAKCMMLDGNIYGSGTHCESGDKGRNIIVRNYGARVNSTVPGQENWFHHSTRPMGTIQRCGNLVIDHSNFTFTGMPQLGYNDGNLYSVMKVDSCLYISDSSALTLGSGDVPAHMDSIRRLQSAYLIGQSSSYNVFSKKFVEQLNWGWIGVVEPTSGNADAVCYMNGLTSGATLSKAAENIILFNGPTKLWVRYHEGAIQKYGELKGFFRMLSPYRPKGIESFAFARPKIMDGAFGPGHNNYNMADGGFLSYNTDYNDYLAPGYGNYLTGAYVNTNTKQYPYTNVISVISKENYPDLDVVDYRMWVMAEKFSGQCWYVDGTRGLGVDDRDPGRGLYPDKPKLSVSGTNGVYSGTRNKQDNADVKFDYSGTFDDHIESDIIFVVGAIKDVHELVGGLVNQQPNYELKLYRYPGGHELYINGKLDGGPDYSGNGSDGYAVGPGPNYGAMIDVTNNKALTLNNVFMDGLYGHTSIDRTYLKFKETDFTQGNISEPMIVTRNGANLTIKGNLTTDSEGKNPTTGTIVKRGYNNTDASNITVSSYPFENYYLNSDFDGTITIGENNYQIINGGGLFVDSCATVNVEGLVSIFENTQKNGTDAIPSNVYLPTFNKYLQISNTLSEATRIGVTNPMRNTATGEKAYRYNTFSPVAVAINGTDEENTAKANAAWLNNNFHDDLHWFFGSGYNIENGSHTAYYKSAISDYKGSCKPYKTLFFGWTWNNVVRRKPNIGYDVNTVTGNVTITSQEGLAWLISKVNGLNGETKTDFNGKTIEVNAEIEGLDQYIWVPVGSEKVATANFAGTFDGKGHLIWGLTIRYIGIGDSRYEFNNYGMFGKTNGATINRTFLVEEHIEPNSKGNMGGLIGMMQSAHSVVSNSEAAVKIQCEPTQQTDDNACGGLVGFLIDGEIHSSMAMPDITAVQGYTGGLVGSSSDPDSNTHSGVKLSNSFTNAQFNVGTNVVAGGLLGNNILSTVENCYANLTKNDGATVASLVHTNTGSVNKCYGKEDYPVCVNNYGDHISNCTTYSSVYPSYTFGYLYFDNLVTIGSTKTPLYQKLNEWVGNSTTYAKWVRPTLAEINGDLPILLLCNESATNPYAENEFRSMGTITNVPKALQYGGTVRDGHQLNGALGRLTDATDALFIYGDITTAPTEGVGKDAKISIHEDAAIVAPGSLTSHGNTYVGITFDNTFRKALDYYGDPLTRDWHMLSTPLSDAPLGIDYNGDETLYSFGTQPPAYNFVDDGYFPSTVPSTYVKPLGERFIYPYDYYCWYEPQWQWINFKRNGPSHHHFDPNPSTSYHDPIEYHYDNDVENSTSANVNESTLVPGKGYMMSIDSITYMQSHGHLNNSPVSISLTARANSYGEQYVGHNLIGNPFHAYLDFEETCFGSYYLYDADKGGYITYPSGGSSGGEYGPQYLHPHQAFFVKVDKSHAGPFEFNTTMLTTRKSSTFRGNQPAYPLVNLYAEDAEGRNDILVVEFERPENGGGFKAKSLRNGKHQMYARFNGEDYGAFFAKKGTERVAVHFKTDNEAPTPYTLRWNLRNGEFHNMRLIDNITGINYDMLANDSYTFEASKFDYSSRFYIVFSCTDVEEHEIEAEGNFAFYDGSQWIVNGSGELQLIDLTGRVLETTRLSSEQNRLGGFDRYATGVYLLRLKSPQSTKVQKIIIMQ